MSSYAVRRYWDRVAQIRNTFDQRWNEWEQIARAHELAVIELYSDACAPWFDNRAFLSRGGIVEPTAAEWEQFG